MVNVVVGFLTIFLGCILGLLLAAFCLMIYEKLAFYYDNFKSRHNKFIYWVDKFSVGITITIKTIIFLFMVTVLIGLFYEIGKEILESSKMLKIL